MGNAQKLIVDFAREIELEEPAFTDNVTSIQFGDMIVDFIADDDNNEMCLYVDLGQVTTDEKERLALYSRLLKLNCFGVSTAGGSLAVDQKEERFSFSRSFSIDGMDATQFLHVLDAFLNLTEDLKRQALGQEESDDASEQTRVRGGEGGAYGPGGIRA